MCDSQKHLIENCNLTHSIFDKWKVVKHQQYLEPVKQRQPYKRIYVKMPWHSLINEVQECACKVQDNNESYIENASWMSWDSDTYIPSEEGEEDH